MHNLPKIFSLLREVIIPISRKPDHKLGPRSLHNFLMKFETPFERDKIWSGPAYFEDSSFKDEGTTRIQN